VYNRTNMSTFLCKLCVCVVWKWLTIKVWHNIWGYVQNVGAEVFSSSLWPSRISAAPAVFIYFWKVISLKLSQKCLLSW
jgi:hypothetical protein